MPLPEVHRWTKGIQTDADPGLMWLRLRMSRAFVAYTGARPDC
jgi:hypothetical protein